MKLAEAFVDITLRAGRLIGGLRDAETRTERSARNMGRSMERAGNRMRAAMDRAGAAAKRLAGALAAAFTAGALIRSIRTTVDELDRLNDRAATIGTTATTIASFQFAAGQTTGLGAQATAVALERFTKRVGEAAAGAGEARVVLRELGLDAERLSQLPLDEQFIQVARAISELRGRGQQLTATAKLFGDESRALLPLLNLQEDSIRRLLNEYRALSGGIDEGAAAADRLLNATARMSASFTGLKSRIITELVVPFEIMADALKANISLLGAFARTMRDISLGNFQDAMASAALGLARAARDLFGEDPELQPSAPGTRDADFTPGGGGGGSGMSNRSIGLDTQLGTFNISRESVSLLRNIASSNDRIADALEGLERENVLGALPLT